MVRQTRETPDPLQLDAPTYTPTPRLNQSIMDAPTPQVQLETAETSTLPTDCGLLVLRLGVAALMFSLHGGPRLVRAFNYSVFSEEWPFVDLVANLGFPMAGVFAVASALSESIGALLLATGLFTRMAATVLAIDMGVALSNEISGGDPIELPALYFLGAIVLAIMGSGRYGLDALRRRRR
jgi:putative oxidoreductase